MSNLLLIFDTETSGLWPKSDNENNKLEYPFIVQLSFIVFDLDENKIVEKYNKYIQQNESMDFNSQAFKINNITKEMCDNGVHIVEALNQFYTYYMNVKHIIAHNLDFDKKMIQLEILRNYESLNTKECFGIQVLFNDTFNELWKLKAHCTMIMGKHITNITIKGRHGPFKKMPKLIELYKKLFNETPKNLHNSLIDCVVCLKCFVKIQYDKTLDNDELGIELE